MSIWENFGKTDEWYTPKYIFDALGCEFDLDVAAPVNRTFCNVPAKEFITENSLDKIWNGFIWMNPPFGGRNNKTVWLDKIFEHGNGVALTPDRTSAPWFQKAANEADALLFVAGKIKFVKPDGTTGDSPGNGTTLFAYGSTAVQALQNAQINKLGTMFIRYGKN
jgi:hypothetical protein